VERVTGFSRSPATVRWRRHLLTSSQLLLRNNQSLPLAELQCIENRNGVRSVFVVECEIEIFLRMTCQVASVATFISTVAIIVASSCVHSGEFHLYYFDALCNFTLFINRSVKIVKSKLELDFSTLSL